MSFALYTASLPQALHSHFASLMKFFETRGQRPNESQKAVIIDMIKSVGEIASKMWPVV